MALLQTIDANYKRAFREQDKLSIEVLRLVKTALMNAEIEKRAKVGNREAVLTDEEALAVLKRHIKSLEEAKELFEKGGRDDLVQQNEAELAVLKKYVPAALGEEEVKEKVKEVMVEVERSEGRKMGPQDFGKVMGAAMKALGSAADGVVVSRIVKKLLEIPNS